MDWFNETYHGIAAAGVLLGLLVKPWDRRRVSTVIIRKGGTIIGIETGAYNIGWLVGIGSTLHEVQYTDGNGETHLAELTTSLLTGASLVTDLMVPQARLLRKNPVMLPSASRKKDGTHYLPEFPSGLPVDEKRKPRPRLARSR